MPSIDRTLSQVSTIDTSEQPFIFEVEGARIIGRWDITNSVWFAPGSIQDDQRDYKIEVDFDSKSGEYSLTEHYHEQQRSVGVTGAGMKKEFFKGSMNKQSFSMSIGGEKDGSNGIGLNTIKFDTETIKAPLRDFLKSEGWEPKRKGVFGKLFG